VKIAGPTEAYTSSHAEDFGNKIVSELHATVDSVTESFTGLVSADDIAPLGTRWRVTIDDKLLPDVTAMFMRSAAAQRERQYAALNAVDRPSQAHRVSNGVVRSGVTKRALIFADRADRTKTKHKLKRGFVIPAVSDPEVEQYLLTAKNRLVNLGDEVWNVCRGIIINAAQNGLSTRVIKEQINHEVSVSEARANVIARTEINRASNSGAIAQMRKLEIDTTVKTWSAVNDGRTREAHAEADGQTVPLDQAFDVGGEPLDAPGDGSAENCINCRCTVTYDIPDDDLADWTP
jgi:SPP1 gp7 family putative phage head morphogenesis protein